ncbi:MAG: MliC family protein [Acidobacteriota bacterium]
MRCLITLLAGVLALASGARAQTDLTGTSWRLVKFQGGDGTTVTPNNPANYTVAFNPGGRVSVRIDCNRGTGTWKSEAPNQLQLGPLALTRAACLPGSMHDRIARDWGLIRSYTIKDGHLFLSLVADGGTYEYEPESAPARIQQVESKGPVQFDCAGEDGARSILTATFYHTTPELALIERGGQTRPAFQVIAASGAKYEGHDVTFWEAHGEATVTWEGAELKCKPIAARQ